MYIIRRNEFVKTFCVENENGERRNLQFDSSKNDNFGHWLNISQIKKFFSLKNGLYTQ